MWTDSSGINGTGSASSATYVANWRGGFPAVSFNGSGAAAIPGVSLNAITSIFWVEEFTGGAVMLSHNDQTNGFYIGSGGTYYVPYLLRGGTAIQPLPAGGASWSTTAPASRAVIYTGTRITDYLNNSVDTDVAATTLPNTEAVGNFVVAGYVNSYFSTGKFAEILVYNGVVSEQDRQWIEAYFNSKYLLY